MISNSALKKFFPCDPGYSKHHRRSIINTVVQSIIMITPLDHVDWASTLKETIHTWGKKPPICPFQDWLLT